jgi:hypothetical protein
LTALAQKIIMPSLGGVGYMGGSVFQDGKTRHWYIQLRWQGQTERFYRFEYHGVWFPFASKQQEKKAAAQ